MINGTIKVTTEELIAKAASVNQRITAIKQHFSAMDTIANNSGHYWKGEAGDTHRKTFADKQPMLEQILKRFLEHTKDLTDMAQNYDVAEKDIQERLVSELPKDVIV